MPNVPDDAKPSINTEFVRRLEEIDPPLVNILVETERGQAEQIRDRVRQFDKASADGAGIIAGKYFPATVPQETIPDVARLEGVVFVHQDQPAGVMALPSVDQLVPDPDDDPFRQAASDWLYDNFGPSDPFVRNVRIGEVEVPRFNFAQLGDPLQTASVLADSLSGDGPNGEMFIPTKRSVDWIRDSPLTDGLVADDTKVAVIDTGHTPTPPENRARRPRLESFVPGEPPGDFMSHGSWCTNMVTGYPSGGAWGTTAGVAPGSKYGHFKALNTFPGFGRTSWILGAMDSALAWGADVISMSLGGAQQGPVNEDPFSRFITENCKENAGDERGAIFVVAAGNAGPEQYRIGSPGVAPKALTVGSWSLTDQAPAVFSSRGPQGTYYSDKDSELSELVSERDGVEAVKPDVVAPGGGRVNSAMAEKSDELLFQTSTGWYDGLKDGLKDGRSNMKGTSMATPAAAGLVKRLYDAGIVTTAADVKKVVRDRGSIGEFPNAPEGTSALRAGKSASVGWGPLRESLFEPR